MNLKNIFYAIPVSVFAFIPLSNASAQIADNAGGGDFQVLLTNILEFTNGVLIPFILGIGFLVFVWGMFQFFIAGGANDEAKEKGKSLMIWAIVGFVMIFILWGIVNLLVGSTGLADPASKTPIPQVGLPTSGNTAPTAP